MSEFDDFFKKKRREEASLASTTVMMSPNTPDQLAQDRRIAQALDVPTGVVSQAPDVFAGQVKQKDETDDLLDAEKIRGWLRNPENAALAVDDVKNLTNFERIGRSFEQGEAEGIVRSQKFTRDAAASLETSWLGRVFNDAGDSFDKTFLTNDEGKPNILGRLANYSRSRAEASDGLPRSMVGGERVSAEERSEAIADRPLNAVGQMMQEKADKFKADGFAPMQYQEVDGIGGAFRFIAENLSASAPDMAVSLASGGFAPIIQTALLGGEVNEELAQRTDLSRDERVAIASGTGVVMAGFEMFGLSKIFGDLLPTGIAIDAVDGALADKLIKNGLSAAAAKTIQAGIVEGSTELIQEGLVVGVTSLSGGKYKEGEIVERLKTAFITGGAVGAGMRGGLEVPSQGGKEFMRLLSKVNKTGQSAKKLEAVDDLAAGSNLKERAPDKFLEALETAGLTEQDLYVPAQDVQEYFQSQNLSEAEVERWGIDPQVFAEKIASGGDVVIPISDYAATISGTQDADWLRENAVLDPDEMSPSQAQRFNEEAAEAFQQAYDEILDAQRVEQESQASDAQVYDGMYSQLRSAGRSVDVAQNEARVWQSFWNAMAERYGDDPLNMARRFGVRVQGPNRDVVAGRRRGDVDIMLNTMRKGGGKATGQSLIPFLQGIGGLRDQGGELAAMDAPKKLIAATRADYDNRQLGFGGVPTPLPGQGLDDAARRAVEAGYFPQLLGEIADNNTGEEGDLVGPLLEAIGEELSGRQLFIDGEGPDAETAAFAEELSRMGVGVNENTNDEIITAMEEAQAAFDAGDEYFQPAPDVEGEAFKSWAGTDQVIDAEDVNDADFSGDGPFVLRAFHGTTHNIESFDASKTGNKEGQFGAVNYFTSSEHDADVNYAGEGPDLSQRIKLRAERLEANDDMDMDDARQQAREELSGGDPQTLEVFIKTEKPFVVSDDSPWTEFVDFEALEGQAIDRVAEDNGVEVSEIEANRDDYEDQIDEARWEIESETENPLIEAIQMVADRYDVDPSGIFESVADFQAEGGRQGDLEAALRNSEALSYAEDYEDGGLIGYHILGEIIQELGFDSIILKNAETRFETMDMNQGTAHIHVFDENKTNIKSVENKGSFDQNDDRILYQDGDDKRGSIQFPRGGLAEGETVINLFERADLSTFIHESGHFFLEAFTEISSQDGAPDDMAADMATIREFLGVEDGKGFDVEHHEKWARAFEAYTLDGKAPSLALADAFARFKSWLTRIYSSIMDLDVKLSPEVRDVMDRMLATEAEITEARESMAMKPLFTDGAPDGMADGDFKTYQRMARRSVEQAEQRLLKKTMAKVKRERESWYKTERSSVRLEVEGQINSQREHRLVEMLANKQWLGADRDVPDMQIDRAQLVDLMGEGVIPELSRQKLGGKRAVYGSDGESPQVVATFFGFKSVTEMIGQLQNTPKRREAIEIETDRIMVERYGDPLNDGSIEEEALVAIHADQQASTVVAEARHLNKRAGRPTGNTTAKAYRVRARQLINDMSVRDIMRPDVFLNAERKASRDAEKAFAQVARGSRQSGDALDRAAVAKERQLLNHYLYREAKEAEQWISKGREKARSYEAKKTREKIGTGFIEQIDGILERFDFRVRSNRQVERSESLRDFVRRMTEEGREAELSISDKLLDESRRMHFTRLPVGELRGVFDTLQNLEHMGKFKRKLIDQKNKRDLDETVGRVLESFDANVKKKAPSRTASKGEQLRKDGRDYLNLTLNADTLLREVDGFADLGNAYTAIKQPIDEGMARLTERRLKMANDLDEIYNRYSAETLRDMSKKRSIPALNGEFSQWEIISIALNTGNVDNYKRLTNEKTKGGFSEDQVNGALRELTEQDWRTVQSMWDYINGYWSEISAKEKRTTGVVPTQVESKLMVEAPDFVKGGYYPIKYDSRLSGRATEMDQEALTQALMGGRHGKAQTANGHTKERALNVTMPLKLDLSVAHSHLAQVLYDLEIGEAVTNSYRVLQDDRVKNAFLDGGKKSDHEALEIWLQDVAAGDRVSARGMEVALRHLRSGFTISRLAVNVSTALIQPSGLAQSAVVVGKRAMAAGVVDFVKNPQRWTAEAMNASSFMRERQSTFERDIFNVVGDLEGGPVTGRWAKFQRDVVLPLSFLMMQKVQFYVVDMPTWVGAYNKELKNGGDNERALLYADRMVARAQGSGLMSDRGMLERGTTDKNSRQRELPRMLTALGSYMFAKGNVAYEATMKTNFRDPVEAIKWAMDIALLFTFEAVLYSAVKGFGPEEDEELGTWLLKETGFSMMSTIPLAREISGGLQGFGSGGILGSTLDKAFIKPITQAQQGEYDKALVKSLVDMTGIWFHLPSSQTNTILNAVFDDDMDVKNEIDPLAALGVGTGRGNNLADYFMSGDEE